MFGMKFAGKVQRIRGIKITPPVWASLSSSMMIVLESIWFTIKIVPDTTMINVKRFSKSNPANLLIDTMDIIVCIPYIIDVVPR